MLKLLPAIILLIVAALSITLNKAYGEIPAIEVKRRARKHDMAATKLYKAVVYEKELSLLLWLGAIFGAAGGLVLLTRGLSAWLAFVVVVALLWLSFTWLPFISVPPANYLSVLLAPYLGKFIRFTHPVLGKLVVLSSHLKNLKPDRLYQTDDLLELLDKQAHEESNRIPKERLDMAGRALTFGDILVKEIMIPRRQVVFVKAGDDIGPVLMGELHSSGHSRFPVYETKEDNVVGTLYMKDIIDVKKSGKVSDYMKKEVYYAHEDNSLEKALHAFLKTKHHLFMVVDKFEEIVGIITIEDIIEEIIGRPIVDEFDKYDDLRAVAESLAHKEHTEKTTEVIE